MSMCDQCERNAALVRSVRRIEKSIKRRFVAYLDHQKRTKAEIEKITGFSPEFITRTLRFINSPEWVDRFGNER